MDKQVRQTVSGHTLSSVMKYSPSGKVRRRFDARLSLLSLKHLVNPSGMHSKRLRGAIKCSYQMDKHTT